MILLDGLKISKKRNEELKDKIDKLILANKRQPKLIIIQVGNNPASNSYIKSKIKNSTLVGIDASLLKYEEDITEEELLNKISLLNLDHSIDGILVQLPLPKHLNERKILDSINYLKDVDGFHTYNSGLLFQKQRAIHAATPEGIINLLNEYKIKVEGLNAVVIGRSNIVGFPISKLLLDLNATVTICHSKTKNLKFHTKHADLIIAAIGKPLFLTKDMVKKGVIIIDVGINRLEEKLVGDVDFENVKTKASYITPVPKGVGPMTVNALLENLYKLYLIHENL